MNDQLGFIQTDTGFRATDAQVQWWESRDTCPACSATVEPYMMHPNGIKVYKHDCEDAPEWSA